MEQEQTISDNRQEQISDERIRSSYSDNSGQGSQLPTIRTRWNDNADEYGLD